MTRILRVVCVMLALTVTVLLSRTAAAGPVVTEFCFSYALDYEDGATGDLLTGSATMATGVFVEFYDEFLNQVAWDGYVSDSAPDSGCIRMDQSGGTILLDDARDYTVKVYREALVNGNTLLVRGPTGGTIVYYAIQNFRPSGSHGTYQHANGDTWTRLAATDPTLIMAAAKFAMQRRPAGLSGETFTFRNAACGGSGSSSCYDYGTEIIWIAHADRKFHVASMMGYAVSHYANSHFDPDYDGGADMDDCIPNSPFRINTKEYQSLAITQGIAQFYAAVAFNDDGTDDDCDFQVMYDVDWDRDGNANDAGEDETFSCSESPIPGVITDYRYFDNYCTASGVTTNRNVAYDWLKLWWDYRTDSSNGGYGTDDVYALWADAYPDTWDATGDTCSGDCPFERLEDAGPSDFTVLAYFLHSVAY